MLGVVDPQPKFAKEAVRRRCGLFDLKSCLGFEVVAAGYGGCRSMLEVPSINI